MSVSIAPVIDHPSAWTARDLGSHEALKLTLTPEQIAAVDALLDQTREMAPQEPTREQFSHPALDAWLAEVFAEIQYGRGAVIIAGVDPKKYSHDQMERIYWGFSTHWGVAAVQSALGDKLGRVTFTPIGPDNPTGRAYRSNEELYLHTDNYEIVGLMCLEKAPIGGFSRLASSVAIHNEIVRTRPELLPALYEGFYYASREAAASGKPVTDYKIPVYCYIDGKLSCRYTREFIYRAGEHLGGLPKDLTEALEYMNEIADRDDFRLHFTLEPGEMMLINNYTTLHSRTNFKDSPEQKRSLLRLWLDVPGGRPVLPAFMSSAAEYGQAAPRSKVMALMASTLLGAGLVFGAVDARAQDAQPEEDQATSVSDIVVTGSLIARSDVTSPSPVTVVDQQIIAEAGTLSLSDILRQDPALGSSSRGPANSLSGGGYIGVNMRNLGNRRTLVLVNGKRFPLFADLIANAGQDISTIPTSLIRRIDVLRDGASTTYGADAVSGVVNFILNDRFEGGRMDAYVGQSTHGDGTAWKLSGAFGHSFDRGSVSFTGQIQRQDPINQRDRDWAANPITSLTGSGSSGSTITAGGRVTGTTLLACYPINGGANVAPSCPIDYDYKGYIISGSDLRSVGGVVRYDLTDNLQFRMDAFASRRETQLLGGAQTVNTASTTGPFPLGFAIPSTNSNNPYGQDIRLQWAPTAYGDRETDASTDMFWGGIGFNGRIADRYNWDVSYTYGANDIHISTSNTINATSLYQLLNPQVCATDVVCAGVGAIPNIANLLSRATPLTEGQRNFLLFDQLSDSHFSSEQLLARISGPLMELPAGTASFALGVEHRKEAGETAADPITAQGRAVGSFVNATKGEFTTNEIFGELDLPLLADAPFARRLDLNLQARYSDFSNFGGADTYKVGVNYEPVDGVRFRLTWGTSYRAPDVLELYGNGVGASAGLQDPCNAGGFRAVNATAEANCTALGVPANFRQIGGSLPVLMGGNPGLRPEEGETYTVGVVLQPTFLPGLTASIDYYNVNIDNAISAANQTALMQMGLNDCYADPNFAARAADVADQCYSFATRGSDSSLSRIRLLPTNIAVWSTSGVDVSARYVFENVGPGVLTADGRLSWLESFDQAGSEMAGTFAGGSFGDLNYPEWQGFLKLNYEMTSFDVEWTVNYMGAMDDVRYGTSVPAVNFKNYSGTPDYFSHDLIVRLRLIEDVDITVGVNNVFDKDPPYAFVSTRNTLPTAYDQIGRYVFMTASYRF